MQLDLVAPDSFEVPAALGGVCPHAGSVIKRDIYHSAVCKWWVWGWVINTVDYKSSSTLLCLSLTLCVIHSQTHINTHRKWIAGVSCVFSVWSMIGLITSALIKGIFWIILDLMFIDSICGLLFEHYNHYFWFGDLFDRGTAC